MKIARLPAEENKRLGELESYEILDTLPQQDFDDLTLLASIICKTPIALISLIDQSRQWFKSKIGLEANETSRDMAFCAHAILQEKVFIVEDSFKDERFKDNPLVTSDPNIRFYAGAPLTTPTGQRIGTICVIDNSPRVLSSEQISALEALARQVVNQLEIRKIAKDNLRARRLIDSSPAAMYCIDFKNAEGVFVDWNLSAEKIWGLSKESVIGNQNIPTINSSNDLKIFKSGMLNLIEHESIELQNSNKVELKTWKVPVCDEANNPRYLLSISLDITKQLELERQLNDARWKAEEASIAKSSFLANMSHEIRTPMNAIVGVADILTDTSLTEDQKKYVEIFKKAGGNLLTILNNILDVSKIEAGFIQLEYIEFNLINTINDVVEIMQAKAEEKQLLISLDVDENVKAIYIGDPYRVRQIISNLISNAIKFTFVGEIKILVKVATNYKTGKENIYITVLDTGIGIQSAKLNYLFQSFTQADTSSTRLFGGTGLGLAICKRLVELMGGEIKVVSEVGTGSSFSFNLDLNPSANQEIAMESIEDSITNTEVVQNKIGYNILLVDDVEDNRLVFKTFLKNSNHNITEAENGEIALEKIKTGHFDLVFMDIQMPVMNGYEATELIRKWEKENSIPEHNIIALTAHAFKDEQDKCISAGCNSHLSKPLKKKTLLNLLDSFKK